MKKYAKITPEGTRDLLFEACRTRRQLEDTLSALFESRGFQEVQTPGFEFYDVFGANDEYFPQESMYKLTDNKGRLMVVRPDSTNPIARLVSTKLQGYRYPIRLYCNQTVYRMLQAMNGSSHEIRQMGVELIGAPEGKADLEILATGAASLACCGLDDYRLELGHVGIFKILIDNLQATDEEKAQVENYVENKNYSALGDVLATLPDTQEARLLQRLPRLFGGAEVFGEARVVFASYNDPRILQALSDLERSYQGLAAMGLEQQVIVDFGLVNLANYYSGLIFRGYIEDAGEPVLSGGRYDHLLADFGDGAPAIGFGIQIDLLTAALLRQNSPAPQTPAVLVYGADYFIPQSLTYLDQLASQGIPCEYALVGSQAQALAYARDKGIRQLHIVTNQVEKIEVLP